MAAAVADFVVAVQPVDQVLGPMEVLEACRFDMEVVGQLLNVAVAAKLVQSHSGTAKMMQRIDLMAFDVVVVAKADHLC